MQNVLAAAVIVGVAPVLMRMKPNEIVAIKYNKIDCTPETCGHLTKIPIPMRVEDKKIILVETTISVG